MDKVVECLHHEYHRAEERVRKRLQLEGITRAQRALGIEAYIACMAIQTYELYKKQKKEKMP